MFKLVVVALALVFGAPAQEIDTYHHVTNGAPTVFNTKAECHAAFEASSEDLRAAIREALGIKQGVEIELRETCERLDVTKGSLDLDRAADLISEIFRTMNRQGGIAAVGR